MILLVWQDMLRKETTLYLFSGVPEDVGKAMVACHGHIDNGLPNNYPFHAVHAYVSENEDCRIEGPHTCEDGTIVVITGLC